MLSTITTGEEDTIHDGNVLKKAACARLLLPKNHRRTAPCLLLLIVDHTNDPRMALAKP
jgi:hypothetical protein